MARKKYLDNKLFYKLLSDYYYAKKKDNNVKPDNMIYININKIVTRYVNHKKFYKYTFKDSMISEAYVHCVKAIDSFNPELSENPHAYFTRITENAFIQVIKKEKKEVDIQGLIKNDIIMKDHQKNKSRIQNSKFIDITLDNVNIQEPENFSPITVYKKGKKQKVITKDQYMKDIKKHFIDKHGEEKGLKKLKLFLKNA